MDHPECGWRGGSKEAGKDLRSHGLLQNVIGKVRVGIRQIYVLLRRTYTLYSPMPINAPLLMFVCAKYWFMPPTWFFQNI
jgi:hypothetical protein